MIDERECERHYWQAIERWNEARRLQADYSALWAWLESDADNRVGDIFESERAQVVEDAVAEDRRRLADGARSLYGEDEN